MAKKVTKKTTTKKKTTVRKPRRATKKTEVTVTEARTPEIAEDAIRLRAFEIYTRGCRGEGGRPCNASNPDADWLQAEQELRAAF